MDLVASILVDGATFGFVGLGIMLIFIWGKVADLTPDASFTAGAVGAWLATTWGLGGLAAVLVGTTGGLLAGLVTFLITRLGVQQLLASLIVVGGAYSAHWWLMGRPLQSFPSNLSLFRGDDSALDVAIAITLIAFVAVALAIFGNSATGLKVRAAAENYHSVPKGSQWAAPSTFILVSAGNALVATGGALFASQALFVEINMGVGVLISGLGALLLGWALFGFKPSVFAVIGGAISGALVLRSVLTLSLTLGVAAEWFRAISSVALLVCIVVARAGARNALRDLRL